MPVAYFFKLYSVPIYWEDNFTFTIPKFYNLFELLGMARSPSGKAEDCKSPIVGSIPTRASILFFYSYRFTGITRLLVGAFGLSLS